MYTDNSTSAAALTNREKEILNYLSEGLKYREIADLLFISIDTVKSHARNIYYKLGVDNRTKAVNMFFAPQPP